jgi:methylenetetrahydrofolate dehydrogenase (NADP+) / methenyltetrahydrofolate cyclohydrolase
MQLSGTDLASYIKERHRRQVLSRPTVPKLVIIHASSDPGTEAYLKAKQKYGRDIGAQVEVKRPQPRTDTLINEIEQLNQDQSVHGIIVQLPLPPDVDTSQVVSAVDPGKDIDGLGPRSEYDPATPLGIMWLLAGHQIDYRGRTVAVIGQGRLVGRPLARMLEDSGAKVTRCDIETPDLRAATITADLLVSATGHPGILRADMVKSGAVVVDVSGDAADDLLARSDISITPGRGGVGPMTVAALFDNLLRAAY